MVTYEDPNTNTDPHTVGPAPRLEIGANTMPLFSGRNHLMTCD